MKKKAIIVHSGGMDSSLCLAQAISEFGVNEVLAMAFTYNQRHSEEIDRATLICKKWGVDQIILNIDCLSTITDNALMNKNMAIDCDLTKQGPPNTLVVGRNGLMGRIASIHAQHIGAKKVYMGVIGVEAANSGYRDCSRSYMDKLQEILRIDFNQDDFEIVTPLVHMTKEETLELGHSLGVLEFLLETTITCYEGKDKEGCGVCPSCVLRNEGILKFASKHKDFHLSYLDSLKSN